MGRMGAWVAKLTQLEFSSFPASIQVPYVNCTMTLVLSPRCGRARESHAAPLGASNARHSAASQGWRQARIAPRWQRLCAAAVESGAAVAAGGATQAEGQLPPALGRGLHAEAATADGALGAAATSSPLEAQAVEYRHAEAEDWWPVADVHCCAFYPHAANVWHSLLRLDRLLSMHVGYEAKNGRFVCLVAAGEAPAESNGHSSTIAMNPLVTAFAQTLLPQSIQVNFGATHESRGLLGAVVVDTMLLFVPPKFVRTPGGNIREVKRRHIAYLSNLAVAPAAQRQGVGRQLLHQAEALARSWGCRSMALHVDATNTAAAELYRREGYRQAGQQSAWEQFVEGRQAPLVLMLKRLGPANGGPPQGGGSSEGSSGSEGSSSGGAGRG